MMFFSACKSERPIHTHSAMLWNLLFEGMYFNGNFIDGFMNQQTSSGLFKILLATIITIATKPYTTISKSIPLPYIPTSCARRARFFYLISLERKKVLITSFKLGKNICNIHRTNTDRTTLSHVFSKSLTKSALFGQT